MYFTGVTRRDQKSLHRCTLKGSPGEISRVDIDVHYRGHQEKSEELT
jgi:hypothetical protein